MQIEKIQRENKSAGSTLDYLRDQIREVEAERESMTRELEKILRQPFFKS
jgi:chromosome segregation ATPase